MRDSRQPVSTTVTLVQLLLLFGIAFQLGLAHFPSLAHDNGPVEDAIFYEQDPLPSAIDYSKQFFP